MVTDLPFFTLGETLLTTSPCYSKEYLLHLYLQGVKLVIYQLIHLSYFHGQSDYFNSVKVKFMVFVLVVRQLLPQDSEF